MVIPSTCQISAYSVAPTSNVQAQQRTRLYCVAVRERRLSFTVDAYDAITLINNYKRLSKGNSYIWCWIVVVDSIAKPYNESDVLVACLAKLSNLALSTACAQPCVWFSTLFCNMIQTRCRESIYSNKTVCLLIWEWYCILPNKVWSTSC